MNCRYCGKFDMDNDGKSRCPECRARKESGEMSPDEDELDDMIDDLLGDEKL